MIDFNKSGRRKGQKVRDLFDDDDEFESLLARAEDGAETEKASDFVADMMGRFDDYGRDMYITDPQLQWLEALASGAAK